MGWLVGIAVRDEIVVLSVPVHDNGVWAGAVYRGVRRHGVDRHGVHASVELRDVDLMISVAGTGLRGCRSCAATLEGECRAGEQQRGESKGRAAAACSHGVYTLRECQLRERLDGV